MLLVGFICLWFLDISSSLTIFWKIKTNSVVFSSYFFFCFDNLFINCVSGVYLHTCLALVGVFVINQKPENRWYSQCSRARFIAVCAFNLYIFVQYFFRFITIVILMVWVILLIVLVFNDLYNVSACMCVTIKAAVNVKQRQKKHTTPTTK